MLLACDQAFFFCAARKERERLIAGYDVIGHFSGVQNNFELKGNLKMSFV